MDKDRAEGLAAELGGKMKEVYGEVAADPGARAAGEADRASGRLQNAYGSAEDAARAGAGTMQARLVSFVEGRPLVAVLAAAGLGYACSRLTHRR